MGDQNNLTTLAKRLRPLVKLAVQEVIPEYPADHGNLLGLGDDDHTQYMHNSSARTVTAQHSFSPSIAQAPFVLGANAQGQTVTGFKADQLNKSISVSGLGLSGGGALTTDQTITLTSSSNPGAAASILASDASGYLSLLALNVDTIWSKSAGNIIINPTGDLMIKADGKYVLPWFNYDTNIGSISRKYLTLWAAELWVETLVAQDVIATIGGHVLVAPTTLLVEDLAAADVHMHVKHNNLANGDRVYLNSSGKIEWIAVTSTASGSAGNYSYDITRNLDGSGSNNWYAGDAVLNTGTTGDGYIDIYSVSSIRSGTQYGPTIVGNIRTGTTYSDLIEAWAIGNLNGLYGYGVDTYGAALGKYVSGQPNITVDSTNGIRIRNYTTNLIHIDTSGNALFGQIGGSYSNMFWNVSNTRLEFRTNTSVKSYIDTDGGFVVVGVTGGAFDRTAAVTWNDGSDDIATIGSYSSGVLVGCEFKSLPVTGKYSNIYITAEAVSGQPAGVAMKAKSGSTSSWISIQSPTRAIYLYATNTYIGTNSDASDLYYSGKMVSWRSTGLQYDTWPFHPLAAPLTASNWNGDKYSTTSKTVIDLSAEFGAPPGIKAVLLLVGCADDGSAGTDTWMVLSPNNTAGSGPSFSPMPVNSRYFRGIAVVPCNTDGDIYYQISASGTTTFGVVLEIWGYWI